MNTLKKTRQLLMYILAVGIVIFGTVVLVFFAQGYNYDFKNGKISNSGLVLLDSHPNGAGISLNGKTITDKTPYRYDGASAGQLSIDLKKSGHRDWHSLQQVVASQVTFVEYPLLLPDILPRQSVSSPVAFSQLSVDRDSKKAAALSNTDSDLYFMNENGSSKKIYSLVSGKILSISISPDGSRVLIRQSSNGLEEQLLIPTNGDKPTNLTSQFGILFPNLIFSTANSADLFWLDVNKIRKIDTTSRTISSPLLSDVVAFSISQDRIVATIPNSTVPDQANTIVNTNLAGSDRHDVVAMPKDIAGYSALVIHSRFHSYLALRANSSPNTLYLILEPNSSSAVPLKLADNIRFFTTNSDQKLLTYVGSDIISSYDLETNRQYSHDLDTVSIKSVQWFDDYHLVLHSATTSALIDFDGFNNQVIAKDMKSQFLLPNDSKSLLYINPYGGLEKVFLEQK